MGKFDVGLNSRRSFEVEVCDNRLLEFIVIVNFGFEFRWVYS